MKKFEVYTFSVETKKGDNPEEVWNNSSNQDMTLEKSFDNYEDAKAYYDKIDIGAKEMSGYWLHQCKALDWNEYDEEGEWLNGDGCDRLIPDKDYGFIWQVRVYSQESRTPIECLDDLDCQYGEVIDCKTFDNYEDAKYEFKKTQISASLKNGNAYKYWLFSYKVLEKIAVDNDGEYDWGEFLDDEFPAFID